MRVVSRLSAGVSVGRMAGKRFASRVLPVPGGPIVKTLWTFSHPTGSRAESHRRRTDSCPAPAGNNRSRPLHLRNAPCPGDADRR